MNLKRKLPKEWKVWIKENIARNVSTTFIFNVIVENGFSYETVSEEMCFEPILKHEIDEEWKKWLSLNIAKGVDKNNLFKTLLMHGFTFDSIKNEMGYKPTVSLDKLEYPFGLDGEGCNESIPNSTGKTSCVHAPLAITEATKLQTENLEIFYLDNFIDKKECDHLTKLIKSKLIPSQLSSPENDKAFRTSRTSLLDTKNDSIVKVVDDRICELINWDKNLAEPIQGQYYEIGQEFKPHTDYFEPKELDNNNPEMGQRLYTVMVYLNSTHSGGETFFPLINEFFRPKLGTALIWRNLNFDLSPNRFSLHHARQVKQGYKAIITKWFRTGN